MSNLVIKQEAVKALVETPSEWYFSATRDTMPTYDYVCQECGHELETFHSMQDEPLSVCPSCRGRLKRKVGGGSGIIFKGSGFYVNDSRKTDPAKVETKAVEPATKASE